MSDPQNRPKISLVTACYNSESTIEKALDSIATQDYPNIEHIVVDGYSSDRTVEIVENSHRKPQKFISVPDAGIYDALNKGIRLCSGDVIGFLHSDDTFFEKTTLSKLIEKKTKKGAQTIFGDALFRNKGSKLCRYFDSQNFSPAKFRFGMMPAHTTFFSDRAIYEEFGLFDKAYTISADFEILIRFLHRHQVSYAYLDFPVTVMSTGGASTQGLKSKWRINCEMVRACKENDIWTALPLMAPKMVPKTAEVIFAKKIYEKKMANR